MKPSSFRPLAASLAALLLAASIGLAQGRGHGRYAPLELTVPAGTVLDVRLQTPLNTGETNTGDAFSATLAQPLSVDGRIVLPKDSTVTGHVVQAVSSGRLQRPASLTLELIRPIRSEPLLIDGKSHTGRNAALIGGGAAAGAVIGAIAGGGKGAAIGAAAGAGAGTATAYFTGKKELVLPAEMRLAFVVASGSPSPPAVQAVLTPEPTPRPRSSPAPWAGSPSFSDRDRRIISDYRRANYSNLPPGLAKRGGNLPPGLERQLERNGTLPPGLQKRVEPFPVVLTRQLSPLPGGVSRVFLGNRALLLDSAQRILDLFMVE